MTETSNQNPDQNQHITEYLEYYINQEEPADSAILLTGSWGCGKTYYIDRFIEKVQTEECQKTEDKQQRYIFKISVFGLKTIADLDDQISQEIYYSLEAGFAQGARIFGKALTVAGTLLNCLNTPINIKGDKLKEASENLSNKLEKFLFDKNKNNITFVFDDLERTDIPLKELLGHINTFVERDHIKIILIANEDKLIQKQTKKEDTSDLTFEDIQKEFFTEDEKAPDSKPHQLKESSHPSLLDFISESDRQNIKTYNEFKEKVISRTFEIKNNFSIILGDFLQNYKYKELLLPHLNVINLIYVELESSNLRQLKYALNDFEYLFERLNEQQQQHQEFVKELIATFFELKIQIHKQNLKEITSDNVYTRDVWTRFLLQNDYTNIQEITGRLRFFIPEAEQPLWMQLISYFGLEDEEFDTLSKQLIDNFHNYEPEPYYEYFHIVGLMIQWSNDGLIVENTEKIESIAQSYLKKHSPNWIKDYADEWQTSHLDNAINGNINNKTGYAYCSSEDPCFIRIWKLFLKKQKEVYSKIKKNTFESNILEAMQEINILPLNEIILVQNQHQLIFNQINPEAFFDTLCNLKNSPLFKVNDVLSHRYSKNFGPFQAPLELSFWEVIHQKFETYLKENKNIGRLRKSHCTKLLKTIEQTISKMKKMQYDFFHLSLFHNEFYNVQEYLCSHDHQGQKAVFTDTKNSDFVINLPNLKDAKLDNFCSTLTQRYTDLKDIDNVQSELPFWISFVENLEKQQETKLEELISISKKIIHRIKQSIKNQES